VTKPRILSGVQPTGNLHLGNYLGAIRNWVGLQDSHECLFMLADLHAITVPQNPADLTRNTRETAAAYLACGIDPKKSAIFPQSAVTMHSELAWILNCHTPLGWLNRMTQFKEKTKSRFSLSEPLKDLNTATKMYHRILKMIEDDKLPDASIIGQLQIILNRAELAEMALQDSQKKSDDAALGLYAYPVLMAADILGYHATHVPVGADQKQHLELARDIAGAFNRAVGEEFFPLPQPIILPTAARIMSLTDGTKKMSKSDPSDYSRLTLTDDADAIANKIKKAQTDSDPALTFDEVNRPSVANLLTIYAALEGSTPSQVADKFSALKTGQFKAQLAELAVAKLSPITARMRELMGDHTALDAILRDGTERARAIATPIFERVKQRVGFLSL
jgi:tryptophanyl-tRNA synthetase